MYCPKCGKENKEDGKFCQFCGAEILQEDTVDEIYGNEIKTDETDKPVSKEEFRRNLTKNIIGAIIIIIVIAIVGTTANHHRIVNDVKQSTNTGYDTDAVLSVVFEYYFDDAKFKYSGKEDGCHVVTFSGECYYLDEEAEISFDIYYDASDGSSYMGNLIMDGDSYNDIMLGLVLMDVYETYMDEFENGYTYE